LSSHLDEVEVELSCTCQGFGQRPDSYLRTIRADKAYFTSTDAIVDPWLAAGRRSYRRSLLMNAQAPPYAMDGLGLAPAPLHRLEADNDEADAEEADIRCARLAPAAFGDPSAP